MTSNSRKRRTKTKNSFSTSALKEPGSKCAYTHLPGVRSIDFYLWEYTFSNHKWFVDNYIDRGSWRRLIEIWNESSDEVLRNMRIYWGSIFLFIFLKKLWVVTFYFADGDSDIFTNRTRSGFGSVWRNRYSDILPKYKFCFPKYIVNLHISGPRPTEIHSLYNYDHLAEIHDYYVFLILQYLVFGFTIFSLNNIILSTII